jgi:hypothetical protein
LPNVFLAIIAETKSLLNLYFKLLLNQNINRQSDVIKITMHTFSFCKTFCRSLCKENKFRFRFSSLNRSVILKKMVFQNRIPNLVSFVQQIEASPGGRQADLYGLGGHCVHDLRLGPGRRPPEAPDER